MKMSEYPTVGLLYSPQKERTSETIVNCTPKVQDVSPFTRYRVKKQQKTSKKILAKSSLTCVSK